MDPLTQSIIGNRALPPTGSFDHWQAAPLRLALSLASGALTDALTIVVELHESQTAGTDPLATLEHTITDTDGPWTLDLTGPQLNQTIAAGRPSRSLWLIIVATYAADRIEILATRTLTLHRSSYSGAVADPPAALTYLSAAQAAALYYNKTEVDALLASAASSTNLTSSRDATTVTVISDTGTDATLPAATGALAGVLTAADKTKLDAITGTSGVTAGAYTNANITVDEKGRVISASNGTAATPGGSTAQVQFNNAGAFGGVSGLTVDVTTGALTVSANGAASAPAVNITGVPFAGTGTTSFPLVYINETGATASTVLNTAGTLFGVNGNGTSDLINLLKDGVSQCKVGSGGIMTLANDIVTAGACIVGGTQKFTFSGRSRIFCPATGMISVDGITASYPGIKRNGAAWNFRLADDSADCAITAAKATFSGPVIFPPYTVGTVPNPVTHAGGVIRVTNETGGDTGAISDGTNWRRFSDRAIIS